MDWTPTLSSVTGLSLEGKELDGVDHWEALLKAGQEEVAPARTELMLGYEQFTWDDDSAANKMMPTRGAFISGDWKVIVNEW
ncbi:unnamed protein product [Choristocarpus tenellus]